MGNELSNLVSGEHDGKCIPDLVCGRGTKEHDGKCKLDYEMQAIMINDVISSHTSLEDFCKGKKDKYTATPYLSSEQVCLQHNNYQILDHYHNKFPDCFHSALENTSKGSVKALTTVFMTEENSSEHKDAAKYCFEHKDCLESSAKIQKCSRIDFKAE